MTTEASELVIRGAMVFDGVNEQLVEGRGVHWLLFSSTPFRRT